MSDEPMIGADKRLPEITFKAIILGLLLAMLLAASNIYLALKIGTTIAASIPASVVAIGVLRMFRRHNVLECNIVQTAASAGEGVAAAVAFVLPALILLHFWGHFHYLETVGIMLIGGFLGVAFSIPLRRIMLNMEILPFPEGTAVGNVLKIAAAEAKLLWLLVYGVISGAVVAFCQTGLQIFAGSWPMWFRVGRGLAGYSIGFTPAALAAGYIIGMRVAWSFILGIFLTWIVGVPILSHIYHVPIHGSAFDAMMFLWSKYIRFIGVGVMLVGGVWTLLRLLKPVWHGIAHAMGEVFERAKDARIKLPRTEKDISMLWVVIATIVFAICIYFYLLGLVHARLGALHHHVQFLVIGSALYVVVIGFMVATIAAYFTGLVGSSNNPISGILIMTVILLCLIYLGIYGHETHQTAISASVMVIIITTIVATIAAISNENLQDLKAGRMVGSTPWKQQVMLAVGVLAASFVCAPVLNLLFNAYGMAGVYPHAGMDPSQMLAAPQATIMASVAKGVLLRNLDWTMIVTGMCVGVLIIIIDEIVRRKGHRVPALAVGLAVYLPMSIMSPVVIGGITRAIAERRIKRNSSSEQETHDRQHRGILLACGIVAGSSLIGVILAIPFVLKGSANALAIVGPGFDTAGIILGGLAILTLCYWLVRVTKK